MRHEYSGTRLRVGGRGNAGFSLVETSMMLMVTFVLAGALAPIVSDSVDTARAVKAANDASMIATGMIQFARDLGPSALTTGAAGAALSAAKAGVAAQDASPDVLVSDGEPPMIDGESGTDTPDFRKRFLLNGPAVGSAQTVKDGRHHWLDGPLGLIDDHLLTNRAGHRMKGPTDTNGWNGPYVSAVVKSDPWGHRYQINSRWLEGGGSAADVNGRPRRAVFIVSAGANGVIETTFDQPINDATLGGDDIGVRLQ